MLKRTLLNLLAITLVALAVSVGSAGAHSYTFDRDWVEAQEWLLQTDVPEYDGFTVTCKRIDRNRHLVCRVVKPNGSLHVKLVYHRYAWNRVRVVFFMRGVAVDETFFRYYR